MASDWTQTNCARSCRDGADMSHARAAATGIAVACYAFGCVMILAAICRVSYSTGAETERARWMAYTSEQVNRDSKGDRNAASFAQPVERPK